MNISTGTQAKIEFLKDNGFVFFQAMFTQAMAEQARQELESWFQKDLVERGEKIITEAHHDGVSGRTILTKPSHLMIDVYGKSQALDTMVEKILTDSSTKAVLTALVGEHYDFYGYNIRRMSGAYDPGPAHEWHRDSPGEFGIGIVLTDIPDGSSAATAFVPGSHWYPYDARWHTLFKDSCRNYYSLPTWIRKLIHVLPFNRLLQRKIRRIATGARGRQGDVYYFINDVWHGREPNLHSRETMVLLLGGCASDMKLHHPIIMPPQELLDKVPPALKEAFCNRNKQTKAFPSSIIHNMLKTRQPLKSFSLFHLAQLERRAYDFLGKSYKQCEKYLEKTPVLKKLLVGMTR